eukprot:3475757-Amphidinium_carterae.1
MLADPENSLLPVRAWLCENLPEHSGPRYPLQSASDVPARVVASEITREKLFEYLRQETPYQLTVLTTVWREDADPDGTLVLGQKVVVLKESQARIVRSIFRAITPECEEEISARANGGRPVCLHFAVQVDPEWMNKAEYYDDLES